MPEKIKVSVKNGAGAKLSKDVTGTIKDEGTDDEKVLQDVNIVSGNLAGNNNTAYYEGNTTSTKTVNGNAVTITNDGASNLTITINGVTTTILAGETIGKDVLTYSEGFTSVVITTTVAYRLWIYN